MCNTCAYINMQIDNRAVKGLSVHLTRLPYQLMNMSHPSSVSSTFEQAYSACYMAYAVTSVVWGTIVTVTVTVNALPFTRRFYGKWQLA